MPNPSYLPPGSSGTTTSVAQTAINPGARRMALIGRAGKGPDIPTEYSSAQAAYAAYGVPGSAGELPWGIASAMPSGGIPGGVPAPIIICRVGVVRASLVLLDSTLPWATLYAKGPYAGTAGNGINTPTPGLYAAVTTGTVASTKKITITQGTGVGAVTLSVYDNLLLPADLAAASENDPYVDVAPGNSLLAPATITSAPFAGGADGLSALPGGGSDLWMAQLTMLFSGMVTAPRYFCCLYDAAGIYSDAQAAVALALANTPLPTPTMAFLGSKLGTTIAANAALAGTINTVQATLWGMPGGNRYDTTVNNPRAFDGFYQAASLMALKAALPVEFTGIGLSLPGWTSNLSIATTAGIYRPPSLSDVTALGAAGASFGLSGPGYTGIEVIDHLTTGQVYNTNYAWQQQAAMLDSHHHAQVAAYAAGSAFNGQPAPITGSKANSISGRVMTALKVHEGGALAAVNSVSTTPDPATVGRYLPSINYNLRPTVRNVAFQFSVGFTQ